MILKKSSKVRNRKIAAFFSYFSVFLDRESLMKNKKILPGAIFMD